MKKLLKEILFILLGNLLYAVGVVLFILPSGLLTGGTTGIALAVNHVTQFPVAVFVLLFNALMFIIGFVILGKKFALTTLLSTITYPVGLALVQHRVGDYVLTEDLLLCAIFGGLCIGASIAIVIRQGASTGGMDIPPLVLDKLFKIPVASSLIVFDSLILVMQMFFGEVDTILYGILMVIIYTVVLDKMLVHGKEKIQVMVVSKKTKEIKEMILSEVDRGCTMISGETGYLEYETSILLSVVSTRELYKIDHIIHQVDDNAFMVVSRVSEVRGRGFDRHKKYLDK